MTHFVSENRIARLEEEFRDFKADWDSLEAAVDKCLEFVSRHSALRSERRRECVVLDSFHLIRQHFA
ncbi:hypothetical protein WJX79_009253 [Trebouxia sp. C0005]